MSDPVRLLIVEDDTSLGSSFSNSLSKDGFQCRLVSSGAAAVEASKKDDFQVVILDLALDSSVETIHRVRENNPKANILLLAPLESRQQRHAALEAGADDFMVEPFELGEMRARVEAAMIRSRCKFNAQRIAHGPLVMDILSRKVTFHNKPLTLTPTEFRILGALLQSPGKVVSRQMLHEGLWELGWDGVTNVIEVHINRLRSKMRAIADQTVIRTVRGSGYMIDMKNGTVLA
jgi:two-component system, OmpR family, response regulator